jgi:hypothetical protein
MPHNDAATRGSAALNRSGRRGKGGLRICARF